jgi:hypothetical protein
MRGHCLTAKVIFVAGFFYLRKGPPSETNFFFKHILKIFLSTLHAVVVMDEQAKYQLSFP